MINLITNAIKFSPNNSTVKVQLSLQINENRDMIRTIISVKDKGIGMSEEDQSNLFKPFFKSSSQENRDMNAGGNGLGLSICKKIAEQMNGKILVDSLLNQGTKISLVMYAPATDRADVSKQKKMLS